MKTNDNNILYRDICAQYLEMTYGNVHKHEDAPALSMHIMGSNGEVFREDVVFRDDNDDSVGENTKNSFDVRIRLVKIPENKKTDIYKLISDLNRKYRFVSFSLNEENNYLRLGASAFFQPDTLMDFCEEVLIRAASLADAVYPEVMKTIYGKDKEE